MSGLKEIFVCCNGISNESEILINMKEKRRSFSCSTPEKRIFIKRSVGKNPILDLSIKNTNKSTENTPKAKSNLKIKRIRDQSDYSLLQNSFDNSIQTVQKHRSNQYLSPMNTNNTRQSTSNRQKMQKFINFNEYNQRPFQNLFLLNANQQMFEFYQPQQYKPINMHERRILNQKQDINNKLMIDIQNRRLMKTMKTIVEAIDERSSIPSMQESQLNEMRQISSRATIKSHICDKNQTKISQSPFNQKYESMIIRQNNSKQSLRMANSQNLFIERHKPSDQLIFMNLNKIQMENNIAQKELNALCQQEKFLQQQKQFDRNRFDEQIRKIDIIRGEYALKVAQCQIQVSQIRQIIRDRRQNRQL